MLKREPYVLSILDVPVDFIVRFESLDLYLPSCQTEIADCKYSRNFLVSLLVSHQNSNMLGFVILLIQHELDWCVQYTEAHLYNQLTQFYRLLDASRVVEKVISLPPNFTFLHIRILESRHISEVLEAL